MQSVCARLLALAGLQCLSWSLSLAQAPHTVPFQGKLTNAVGVALPDGTRAITFRLYNGPSGILTASNEGHIFNGASITLDHPPVIANSETIQKADGSVIYVRGSAYTINNTTGVITRASAGAIPDGTAVKVSYQYTAAKVWEETKTVTMKGGLISTALGDTTAFGALAFDQPLYVAVQVGADPEMTPRVPLQAVPFALAIPDASVNSAKLASDYRSLAAVSGGTLTSDGTNLVVPGQVSIGTSQRDGQVRIVGGPQWTTAGWTKSLTLDSGSAVELGHGAGTKFGIGSSSSLVGGGSSLYIYNTPSEGADGPAHYNLVINDQGYVGIGTPYPVVSLEVSGTAAADQLTAYDSVSTGSLYAASATFGTTTPAGQVHIAGGPQWTPQGWTKSLALDNGDAIEFGVNNSVNITRYGIGSSGDSFYLFRAFSEGATGFGANYDLVVNSGYIGIGTTIPQYPLDVNGQIRGFNVSPSDARLKTNVRPLGGGLQTALALQGVTFDWDRAAFPRRNFIPGRHIGFIAQDVEKVLPGVVSTDREGIKSVAYQEIIPVLVEAVKEQQTEIAQKDARLASQDRRIGDLEARLQRVEHAMAGGRP